MYAIAIIGDLFSLVPIVNIFTDAITAYLLGIAAKREGINLYKGDALRMTILTIAIEAIPWISFIPAWTIRVYFAKKAKRALEQEERMMRS